MVPFKKKRLEDISQYTLLVLQILCRYYLVWVKYAYFLETKFDEAQGLH
jgi:hypothetical protein